MNRRWKFSALEFAAMWAETGEEHVPAPFLFTTDIELQADYERACRQAVEHVRMSHGFDVDTVFAAINEPDIRIEVRGFDERDRWRADGLIRILATRRGDTGYLVTAQPGHKYSTSSSFEVTECGALDLAGMVARALPDVSPGRRPDFVVDTGAEKTEIDYEFGRSSVHDTFEDSVTERAAAFYAAPGLCAGTIEIIQGSSIFGPRGISRFLLGWRDLEDDGRYVIDDRHPPTATAADRKQLTRMINARIAEVVRAIKDERV
ncbi:ESX secretion-associated protein EspG [Nocardia sp. NPDC058705]|uniref:ESX secretion-associated protein EspG n=1 Tax=Nocardia sp. NPDC058705 TaxID=3346609 RepID=UPI0036BA2D56